MCFKSLVTNLTSLVILIILFTLVHLISSQLHHYFLAFVTLLFIKCLLLLYLWLWSLSLIIISLWFSLIKFVDPWFFLGHTHSLLIWDDFNSPLQLLSFLLKLIHLSTLIHMAYKLFFFKHFFTDLTKKHILLFIILRTLRIYVFIGIQLMNKRFSTKSRIASV